MFHPENWPPAKNIIPLFVAFHINPKYANTMLEKDKVEYFKRYAPIGCRDAQTQSALESHGVPAWNSGCLTLTLGKTYKWSPNPEMPILVVDALFKAPTFYSCFKSFNAFHKSLLSGKIFKIGKKKKILRRILSKTNLPIQELSCDFPAKAYPTPEQRIALADTMLKTYSQAPLVITSRIHVALPCLAMGTPVIFVDGSLEKETERARIGEFLPYFNLISINQKDEISANFNLNVSLTELRNTNDAWRQKAKKIATICETFAKSEQ